MMRLLATWFARRAQLAYIAIPALVCTSLSAAEAPKTAVADLRYGVALYHYYQQNYLESISELMVADARDGIHGHGDNPELIAGGFSLAFGMQHHAEQLFNRILQDNKRPQNVRDAAWFYLGKLQYARSDWAGAALSFSHISEKFNSQLLAEAHALQINLLIKDKQFSPISVKQVDKQKLANWEAYALYNLGAAHARDGDMKAAQTFFSELLDLSLDDSKMSAEEYQALIDKAHTAMGYSALQEKNYTTAINEFRKVSLDGIESNQALLGYGWAAIAQEKYADALRPWQVLQQRSLLLPAAQEALLALPFAYEKLNAQGDALREYEKAEQILDTEIALVRDMRATLTQGELLTLVGSKPVSDKELKAAEKKNDPSILTALITDDGQNWLKINNTSVIKTRSMYLRELFAQNEFQTAVLDLRDLLKLQKLLQDWQPKLVAYTELLEQKKNWRQQKEQQLAQQSLSTKEADLSVERARLVDRLAKIKANDDYIALADDATRKTYSVVERSEANIQRIKAAGQDTAEYEPQLKIVRGILLWRAAQTYPQALQGNEKSIVQIDESLTSVQTAGDKIAAVTNVGLDIQTKLAGIQQQQAQVQDQLNKANSLIDSRAALLRAQVDKQLENHEKRLARYLAQSHLAVARLYDGALRKSQ